MADQTIGDLGHHHIRLDDLDLSTDSSTADVNSLADGWATGFAPFPGSDPMQPVDRLAGIIAARTAVSLDHVGARTSTLSAAKGALPSTFATSSQPSTPVLAEVYDPYHQGAYGQYGSYYSGSDAYAQPPGTSLNPQRIAYASFDAVSIERDVVSLAAAGDTVSVKLSYTVNDTEGSENPEAAYVNVGYFTSAGYQDLVDADATNHTGPGGGTNAYVYDDVSGQGEVILSTQAIVSGSAGAITETADITSSIISAGNAGRDLVLSLITTFSGTLYLVKPTITINAIQPSGAAPPVVSNTVADQSLAVGSSDLPFSTVVVTDPGSSTGRGDMISLTILDSSGNATDTLGTLTETNGAALVDEGGGSYVLDPSGAASTQTLQTDLQALRFTALGAVGATATLEIDVQSISGSTTDNQGTSIVIEAPCFTAGTTIRTARGEIAVEELSPGDLVVVVRAPGQCETRPIRWIGRRRVDVTRHPAPERVRPIRFAPGSLGQSLPVRPLIISPDHALLVDGLLIAARQLVNHASIAVLPVATVDYFHIELDRHDILFAEGVAAESYLDTGNRHQFEGRAGVTLHPDFARTDHPDACLPLTTCAIQVEPVWRRLARRAEAIGLTVSTPDTDTDAELCVELWDGRVLVPGLTVGKRCWLSLDIDAAEPTTVRLRSRHAAPTETRPWLDDRRQLGVCVGGLNVWTRQSALTPQRLPLDDDDRLGEGWWNCEQADDGGTRWRWTNGAATLTLPAGTQLLEIEIRATGIYPSRVVPDMRRNAA